MGLDEHTRRQFSDGWLNVRRESVHRQQQLVPLRLDSLLFGCDFAEVKKLADLAPELGQIPVLFGGKIAVHEYIVSRHIYGRPHGRD